MLDMHQAQQRGAAKASRYIFIRPSLGAASLLSIHTSMVLVSYMKCSATKTKCYVARLVSRAHDPRVDPMGPFRLTAACPALRDLECGISSDHQKGGSLDVDPAKRHA